MKPFVSLMAFFFGTVAFAQAERAELVPIEAILDSLRRVETPNGCSRPDYGIDSALVQSFGRGNFPVQSICPGLGFENVCQQASLSCATELIERHPNIRNAGHFSTCWALDPGLQQARRTSVRLRKEIFQFAADFFHGVTQDPELQKRCCGSNAECIEHFSKTKLLIAMGLPAGKVAAFYKPALRGEAARVLFSEGRLLNEFNQEGIERVILHELGHACQYSRHVMELTPFSLWLDGGFCSGHIESKQDFVELLGEETAQCVRAGLEKADAPKKCLSAWMIEALASSVFADRLSNPAHFDSECDAQVDLDHGPSQVHIDCLLKREDVRKKICGGQGTQK